VAYATGGANYHTCASLRLAWASLRYVSIRRCLRNSLTFTFISLDNIRKCCSLKSANNIEYILTMRPKQIAKHAALICRSITEWFFWSYDIRCLFKFDSLWSFDLHKTSHTVHIFTNVVCISLSKIAQIVRLNNKQTHTHTHTHAHLTRHVLTSHCATNPLGPCQYYVITCKLGNAAVVRTSYCYYGSGHLLTPRQINTKF